MKKPSIEYAEAGKHRTIDDLLSAKARRILQRVGRVETHDGEPTPRSCLQELDVLEGRRLGAEAAADLAARRRRLNTALAELGRR